MKVKDCLSSDDIADAMCYARATDLLTDCDSQKELEDLLWYNRDGYGEMDYDTQMWTVNNIFFPEREEITLDTEIDEELHKFFRIITPFVKEK